MTSRSSVPVLLAAALLAGGCAAVARARRVQDPASAVPGERTPTAAELGLAPGGPLRLEDAEAAALRAHPSVLLARRALEVSAARLEEISGQELPALSASASVDYRDQGPKRGPVEHRFLSGGFQVSWLLFDFGRTSALVRQAARQWFAAQSDLRQAEVDAADAVRTAYFTLDRQLRLREVAREAVDQFRAHLDQVRQLVEVGKRIPYDETRARVDLGNARLALSRAENAVSTAQAVLASSLGLAEVTDWTPVPSPEPQTPATFELCWREAAASVPALAAATAREEAASALVDARVAELYPSLDLGLGYSASGSRSPLPWSLRAGPSLSWVPFDGFASLYSVDEAAANLRGARAARAREEQRAWLELRTAWLAVEDARRRLDLTDLTVKSAEETQDLAKARFEVGAGTTVEVTDAEQAAVAARGERVQARADLRIALSGLWRAMGRTTGKASEPGDLPGGRRR